MKKALIAAAGLVSLLFISGSAMAGDRHHRHHHGNRVHYDAYFVKHGHHHRWHHRHHHYRYHAYRHHRDHHGYRHYGHHQHRHHWR